MVLVEDRELIVREASIEVVVSHLTRDIGVYDIKGKRVVIEVHDRY